MDKRSKGSSNSKSRSIERENSHSQSQSQSQKVTKEYSSGNQGRDHQYQKSQRRRQSYSQSQSRSRSRSQSPQQQQQGYKRRQYNNNYHNNDNNRDNRDNRYGGNNQYRGERKKKIFIPQLNGKLIAFQEFMRQQKDRIDIEQAKKYYNQYKESWENKQNDIFFEQHGEEGWFKEKYDPIYQFNDKQEKIEESQKKSQEFLEQLSQGNFDKVDLTVSEDRLNLLKSEYNNPQQEGVSKQANKLMYVKDTVDLISEPFYGFDTDKNTLFIRNIPIKLSKWDLKQHLVKLQGFVSISLSEPKPIEKFRYGWVQFDNEQNTDNALIKIQQLIIDGNEFGVIKSNSAKKQIRYSQSINTKTTRNKLIKLISVLDMQKQITDNPLGKDPNQMDTEELENQKVKINEEQRIDLSFLYLRSVHSYCYLCGLQTYDQRMLTSKCGVQHLRQISQGQDEEEEEIDLDFPTWQSNLVKIAQQKIDDVLALLEDEEYQQKQDQQNQTAQIEEKLVEKIQKKSKDNKIYPCLFYGKDCEKRFKGPNFVLKHLETKHDKEYKEMFQSIRKQLTKENYCNDENRPKDPHIASQQYNTFSGPRKSKYSGKTYQYQDKDAPVAEQAPKQLINPQNIVNYSDI